VILLTRASDALDHFQEAGVLRRWKTLDRGLTDSEYSYWLIMFWNELAGGILQVAWDAAGARIDLLLTGSCEEQGNETRHIDRTVSVNTGSADIAVSDLIGSAPLGANETCAVTVSLERASDGDIDPAFEGGSIVARQIRSVDVEIAP